MKWILFILLISNVAFSQRSKKSVGNFRSTKIGAIAQNFTGTANRSFSSGGMGYGAEIGVDGGGSYFRYFLKGRMIYAEGSQNFLNGTTAFSSRYKFAELAPELGLSIFPVVRRDDGMNLYLFILGCVSYNYLELGTIPTGSTQLAKDQSFGYGYGGGIGFEYLLRGERAGAKNLIYGEFGFRDERTTLVQTSNFEISGMTFSLGFGF